MTVRAVTSTLAAIASALATDEIRVSIDDGVALICLCGAKLNALSTPLLADLGRTLEFLEAADEVLCAIITGEGRAFSVGAQLKEMAALPLAGQRSYNAGIIAAFDRLERLPMPTIAAINGYAMGGGLELALACTFRVAARDAQLALPEVRLGILPGAGGTQRLPRLVGRGPALDLLLTGRTVDAAEALRLGVVDRVAVDEDVVDVARGVARDIAGNAPLAVRAILAAVEQHAAAPLGEAISATEEALAGLLATRDAAEGMSAFAERRKPQWSGA